MEIIRNNLLNLKNIALILGFFDGVHAGHREVIKSAVSYAKTNSAKTALLTFKNSPAEYFKKPFNYIFPREYSYKLLSELGVDYIIEKDFEDLVNISAHEFLESLIKTYSPISISTGFNHTFGKNRQGNPNFLENFQENYNYKYFCAPEFKMENITVSSTNIKSFLSEGKIKEAYKFLTNNFSIKSKVISGDKIGRTIGFPTANLKYPNQIVKIPYGVYFAKVFDKPAVLNWGVKPTFDGKNEVLEVHILGFEGDLYGQELNVEIIDKIRDEKKFKSVDELKKQIKKDIEKCLKL